MFRSSWSDVLDICHRLVHCKYLDTIRDIGKSIIYQDGDVDYTRSSDFILQRNLHGDWVII